MTEDARRSIDGFAETLACLGRTGVGGASEIRAPGLVGAHVPWARDNHWIDAAVARPGADLADAPHCVWSTDGSGEIAMPCMALDLDGWEPPREGPIDTPPLDVAGAVNDRAYGQIDRLAPLIAAIDDPRVRTHGVRIDGEWACVTLALLLDDDVSVQYVATEPAYRRRGLAAWVVGAAIAEARADGARTATLQASPDGFGVYERLGFRTVTTLFASIAQSANADSAPSRG
ncbi:GNAT family N-acetyltransferase [Solirubrobacter soli]|uniref:GNAT family N-acetyltransferase n=1 Tax=Solirubrobacter soli TaxID=363832 RepID=UPI00041BEDC9|nr:GNAT family N-acetyltransferase [Solirubrobacter soli]